MYENFYGLRERPFDLRPDPRFLFLSPGHREALANLLYALKGRPGITALTGRAGTGKTTLIRTAIQTANGSGGGIVHVTNPTLTRAELYEQLVEQFNLPPEAAASKPRFLACLQQAISARSEHGEVLALIVDEAQSLPRELLEEVRLLTNVETPEGQSLVVVLVGQPDLSKRLNQDDLEQVKQRVILRCELDPLTLQETAAYIAARVRVAGGSPEKLFTREAVVETSLRAEGIPRMVSVICDNALVTGFAAGIRTIGRDVIAGVCRDFQLKGSAASGFVSGGNGW